MITKKELYQIQEIARQEYLKALKENNDTESRYWLGYKNGLEVVFDKELRNQILGKEV